MSDDGLCPDCGKRVTAHAFDVVCRFCGWAKKKEKPANVFELRRRQGNQSLADTFRELAQMAEDGDIQNCFALCGRPQDLDGGFVYVTHFENLRPFEMIGGLEYLKAKILSRED